MNPLIIEAEEDMVKTKKSLWQECIDPDTNNKYYFNSTTNETTWDKPPDFKDDLTLLLEKQSLNISLYDSISKAINGTSLNEIVTLTDSQIGKLKLKPIELKKLKSAISDAEAELALRSTEISRLSATSPKLDIDDRKTVAATHSFTKNDGDTHDSEDNDDDSSSPHKKRGSAVVNNDDLYVKKTDESHSSHRESQNPYFRNARLSNPAQPDKEVFSSNINDIQQQQELPSQEPLPKKTSSVGFTTGTLTNVAKLGKNLKSNANLKNINDNQEEEDDEVHRYSEAGDDLKSAASLLSLKNNKANKAKPPPANHVPVDALARAGERSLKWLEYVKKHLLATEHVKDAGIFDLRNCARWAATKDFLPRHYHIVDDSNTHHGINEAASIVFTMKSGNLSKHGLRFNGVMYTLESSELVKQTNTANNNLSRWAIHGTRTMPSDNVDAHWKWAGGIYLVRTTRAVVIATYDTGKSHDVQICKAAVDGLTKFMTDYAC